MNEKFVDRYKKGDTPWELDGPDFNLIEMVTGRPIQACRVLDVGCGTGNNAIWLAQHNFQVTGCDVSDLAIDQAGQKAAAAGVECDFRVCEFLSVPELVSLFDFVFDRGCFHSFDSQKEREQFARQASAHLEKDGLWLSLVGSADDPPRDTGPPRLTALEIAAAVEPYFRILSLTASKMGSKRPDPAGNWVVLMQKR
jgi:2-polyprenyl-3-methyl-5-hydroxy-6-metoxy-1,4-benzoquinol methylase